MGVQASHISRKGSRLDSVLFLGARCVPRILSPQPLNPVTQTDTNLLPHKGQRSIRYIPSGPYITAAGLGFRVEVSGFRVHGLKFRVQSVRFKASVSRFRVHVFFKYLSEGTFNYSGPGA